ncbi:hypothetical protein ACOZ4B_14890 [Haloferax prahovense]|uniref:hypothetical protein n=1 Tax=Haloferax TaxID=2251 RepID=UPI00209C509C|nr:hypothetical protein [Haloferax sp. AB510]MCO8265732.1 hypothetical protein [Haloferax sp. AB510]
MNVQVLVSNETSEYFQGDLVVLDQYMSEVLGSDGNGWEAQESVSYEETLDRTRSEKLTAKVYLQKNSTTELFQAELGPDTKSDSVRILVNITNGPKVSFSLE